MIQTLITQARKLFRKEPAVIIGALLTAGEVAFEAAQGAPTWKAALPLIASALVRRYVFSPATHDEHVYEALGLGSEIVPPSLR